MEYAIKQLDECCRLYNKAVKIVKNGSFCFIKDDYAVR